MAGIYLAFGCVSMNDPKPSEIVRIYPETSSFFRNIFRKVFPHSGRTIRIEFYRSPDEVANRVSYNDVKEIENLHAFASLARIRNYSNARKVQIDYQNIDTVSVRRNPFIELLGITGAYYLKNNQILFSMPHLLHMNFYMLCRRIMNQNKMYIEQVFPFTLFLKH